MKQLWIALFLSLLFPYQMWGQSQTLEGRVISRETNQPLAGVELKLLNGKELVQSTKTDENGRYKFDVQAGTYNLSTNYLPDYVIQTYRDITVWEGLENRFDIDLTLCFGLCGEAIYQVAKTTYRPVELSSTTRFNAGELRGRH